MSNFELTGKIVEIYDTQQVTDTFKKREFVVETDNERYPDFIKFQMTQDKCVQLDNFSIGDTIKVSFNIRGRKTERNGTTSYFTNLEAWRLNKDSGGGESSNSYNRSADVTKTTAYQNGNGVSSNVDDDLPF